MALSGELRIHDGASYDWYIVWSATQSIENNTSTITSTFEVRKMASNSETYCLNKTRKIGINGGISTSTWSFDMRSDSVGNIDTIYTKTSTIAHDVQGVLVDVPLYAYFDASATSVGTVEGTLYADLDTIPRASEIGTIPDFNLEDTFSVPVDKKSATFTDDLVIKQGSTTIKTISDYAGGANINLTDAELLNAYNAIDKSASFTFETTTMSGSTAIGTDSAEATGTAAGTAYIKTGGTWRRALPYIKVNGAWKKAVVSIKSGGSWKRGVS